MEVKSGAHLSKELRSGAAGHVTWMHVMLLVFDLELVYEVPDLQGTDNGDREGGGGCRHIAERWWQRQVRGGGLSGAVDGDDGSGHRRSSVTGADQQRGHCLSRERVVGEARASVKAERRSEQSGSRRQR
jgi:hypothetical protein